MASLDGAYLELNPSENLQDLVSESCNKKSAPEFFMYDDTPRLEMLSYVPQNAGKILDVGCHLGAFGRALKDRSNVEVWGIEPNPHTAEIAALQLDRVLNEFLSEDSALPDQYFDAIVFNDVLEHMPDPWAAIEIAKTKLVNGGHIIASLPNLRHIENLIHILRQCDFQYETAGIRDRTHLRFFTKTSIPRLFKEHDFQIMRLEGINEDWWRPSLVRRIAFRIFKNYLEDTRYTQFAIVAKKLR
jgi:2-polyprenyl-3-methyl-5-hydroxy-6-metoxy-1,4-benzoquinol methylase